MAKHKYFGENRPFAHVLNWRKGSTDVAMTTTSSRSGALLCAEFVLDNLHVYIISYHIHIILASHRIAPYCIVPYRFISHISYHIVAHRITTCRIYPTTPYRIVSYRIVSCHIIYHMSFVILYRTVNHCCGQLADLYMRYNNTRSQVDPCT